jgi:hypothetical protein
LPDLGQPKAKLNTLGDPGFATSAPGDDYHMVLVYAVLQNYKHPVVLVTALLLPGRIPQDHEAFFIALGRLPIFGVAKGNVIGRTSVPLCT